MLPISTKELVHFTPEGTETTYLLRAPSGYRRSAYTRAVSERAALIRPSDLRAELRALLPTLYPNGSQEHMREVLNRLEVLSELTQPTEEETAELTGLQADVSAMERVAKIESDRYRRLIAARDFRFDVVLFEAVRYTLEGWEGLEAEFVTTHGLPTDATIEALGSDLDAVAIKAMSLMEVSPPQRKNSASS